MRILAVETSAGPSSCAVIEGEENGEKKRVLSSSFLNVRLTHSETLMPMVNGVLNNAKLGFSDIDYFAVSSGPGSFTGVRIGVAAVKGLAFTLDDVKNCIGVSTLESMAYMWRGEAPNFSGIICPAMDARRSQVYTSIFSVKNNTIARLMPDSAIGISELYDIISESYGDREVVFMGDGAALCYNSFKEKYGMEKAFLPPEIMRYQNAVGVGMLAFERLDSAISAVDLMPGYLRRPQAEREMLAKEAEKSGG